MWPFVFLCVDYDLRRFFYDGLNPGENQGSLFMFLKVQDSE